jgi:hypothetical protein
MIAILRIAATIVGLKVRKFLKTRLKGRPGGDTALVSAVNETLGGMHEVSSTGDEGLGCSVQRNICIVLKAPTEFNQVRSKPVRSRVNSLSLVHQERLLHLTVSVLVDPKPVLLEHLINRVCPRAANGVSILQVPHSEAFIVVHDCQPNTPAS